MARITEAESAEEQIHQQRQDREENSDGVDEQQQRSEQCRSRDQRHPERDDAERFARVLPALAQIEQLAHGNPEQDQPARDLEIGNGDAERAENYFAEKDEPDRNREAGDQSKRPFEPPPFFVHVTAQPKTNRDEPDRINRNKKRDEREQKFFEIHLHAELI